jgi:hypothetical protein
VGAAQPPPPPVQMLALHPQCLQPSSPRRLAWCAVCGAVWVAGVESVGMALPPF